MKVKICGLTNMEDALFCSAAGADALGFVFYANSPRAITAAAAAAIIAELPPYITPIGVFVNEQRSVIEQTIRATGIRSIQLSGDERPEECAGFGVKVIKAFRFKEEADTERLREYDISAAMLDGAPVGVYGGSGVLADFSVALAMKEYHPLFLAGGLNPDNVVGAVQNVLPYAVDISSGVEASPGKKDREKVTLLFERLRHYHETQP